MAASRKRGEREIEAASTPSPGQFNVAKPNALWQIDHTIVDVIVVDEQFRKPIGRSVLTAIKDGSERITADSIESWRPALEKEAAFAYPNRYYNWIEILPLRFAIEM